MKCSDCKKRTAIKIKTGSGAVVDFYVCKLLYIAKDDEGFTYHEYSKPTRVIDCTAYVKE